MSPQTQNWYYNTNRTALAATPSSLLIVCAPIGLMIGVFYLSYRMGKFSWNRIINPALGNPYVKPVPCPRETLANGFEDWIQKETANRIAYEILDK